MRRVEVVLPGGVLVVEGAVAKAAVEDADPAVGELAPGGLMSGASSPEGLVVGADAG
jgi:hypothetical protein